MQKIQEVKEGDQKKKKAQDFQEGQVLPVSQLLQWGLP